VRLARGQQRVFEREHGKGGGLGRALEVHARDAAVPPAQPTARESDRHSILYYYYRYFVNL
jgi:hypothetical protein